ncbi:MAG: hypothetical protein CMH48_00360 [Muricauda sp.]|nr:hypothetical protein [Allomuricauda sp.]MBC29273.1 hypothetical protein [Allomuricauda sp.]
MGNIKKNKAFFNFGLPVVLALFAVGALYKMHMLPFLDSMLNENNSRLSKVFLLSQVNYHHEFFPFSRRPLTTFLINAFADFFGAEKGTAFVCVNFSLLFVAGMLLYLLSSHLGQNVKKSLINMTVFYGSFSVCFAFFPPIFSYDEPLQYSLVFAGMLFFFKKGWWQYVVLFTLAAISKESTVLLVFGLLPLAKLSSPKQQFGLKNVFRIVLPVVLFGIYLTLFSWYTNAWNALGTEISQRTSCLAQNFGTPKKILETVFSFFLALSPFLYLVLAKYKTHSKSPFLKGFLLVLALNSVIVMVAALARESRLFALPLLLLWPVFSKLFYPDIKMLFNKKNWRFVFENPSRRMIYFGLTILNIALCYAYHQLGFGIDNLFAAYLLVALQIMLSHFCMLQFLPPRYVTEASPKTPAQK